MQKPDAHVASTNDVGTASEVAPSQSPPVNPAAAIFIGYVPEGDDFFAVYTNVSL